MRDINHFIDGASFTGASGRFSDVFNPNTGEVQARVQLASVAEMDRAVQAAVHRRHRCGQVGALIRLPGAQGIKPERQQPMHAQPAENK